MHVTLRLHQHYSITDFTSHGFPTWALWCCCAMATVMAFGSACAPPSLSTRADVRRRLPHRKWKTCPSIGVPPPPGHTMVVGLIHCRSRSQASFMMPREHRGRPAVKDKVDQYREVSHICETRQVTDRISEIRRKI